MAEIRKLSTILFADIVGYTAMMQEDEPTALQTLSRFKDQLESLVPPHEGEIIQFFGDGCLLSFDSSVQAVLCATKLQQGFQTSNIPVRMGMHLGEVLRNSNNLFGDSVNLASRIESLSVPGAVLISASVQDQLRNKSEVKVSSLGSFTFKNVQKPMEVFAVRAKGLVVPHRKQLSGKLAKAPQKHLLPYVIGVAAIVLGLLAWPLVQPGSLQKKGAPGDLGGKNQRLAVMVFENQTNLPELDAYGTMISDWLTNGLMESGSATVINAANIEQELSKLNESGKVDASFVANTGLDMILRGRYYLLEDQLYLQANLINAREGDVIYAVKPISGSRDSLGGLLQALSQEILGYWAIKDYDRFVANPPTYEAYQLWLKAEASYISDPDAAIEYLNQAFRADTTFFAPLIQLHNLYRREGKYALGDETFEFLAQRTDQFTPWETLRFQEVKAIREADWKTVASIAERRYHMDVSDQEALHLAVIANNYINRPTKSLELISSFDTIYLKPKVRELSWMETDQIFPHFQLGNYSIIDSIAAHYPYPAIPDAMAVMHMKSLVHMDSIARLARFYAYYREKGLYNNSGRPSPFFSINILLCDELYITDRREVLQTYVEDLEAMAGTPDGNPDHYTITGYVSFYRGQFEQAALSWEQGTINQQNWPGWLLRSQQYERLGRIGHCYALAGREDRIPFIMNQLAEVEDVHPNTRGIREYYQSRIMAARQQPEDAVASLKTAIRKGFSFYAPARFLNDPFLKPLFDNPQFNELVAPQ